MFPQTRLRRLRQHPAMRRLVCETTLTVDDLIYPLFIKEGEGIKHPIATLPGQYQLSVDCLKDEVKELEALNIPAVLLFGIPETKDEQGSHSWKDHGVIQQAIKAIKQQTQNILVIADVCFCEYTTHGHCGIVEAHSHGLDVNNDKTLKNLVKQAVSLAKAGADMVAPSGMMDGCVQALRAGLDQHGFEHVGILSYAVKYSSAIYGPFREAAGYSLAFGDRATYQMNPANARSALREAALDVKEGADMLMVKPAGYYLDVIYQVKQRFPEVPLSAYQVSGEYALIKAAAAQQLIDEQQAMHESLLAIKRAGADCIITYFAKAFARSECHG